MLDNPRLLPAAAMNIGLEDTRGELVLRLDGHAAIASDYLRRCTQALREQDAECAGGVLNNEGDTYTGRAIAAAMSSRFGVGGARFRTGGRGGETDTVAFGVYRREVFERIGGYDEDLPGGEDDELNYRLRDAGGRIVLVPEARATYTVRGSLRGLWRQYFSYGRAKPRVLARHGAQAQPRQLAPAAFIATLASTSVMAARGRPGPLASLLTAYTFASTAASLAAGHRHGWRLVPTLPAVFACLHVAYALGFFAGLPAVIAGRDRYGAQAGTHEETLT
jgi:hypothetical protein